MLADENIVEPWERPATKVPALVAQHLVGSQLTYPRYLVHLYRQCQDFHAEYRSA